jgi:hypothetical protein
MVFLSRLLLSALEQEVAVAAAETQPPGLKLLLLLLFDCSVFLLSTV